MKTRDFKQFTRRNPFRPFSVRLSNGAQYTFKNPEDLGVTKDHRTLVYFGRQGGLTLIDATNVIEIIDTV